MSSGTLAPELAAVPAPIRPAPAGRSGGIHLSQVAFRVFADRQEYHLTQRQEEIGADLLRAYGRAPDATVLAGWRGHTFSSMGARLLADHAGPVADLDLVVLAYQTPDLHVAEVAGCYLAETCPGDPIAYAVSEQGAGAAFTALRVADAMYRFGDLTNGALFVFDPTTPICEPERAGKPPHDSAVLMMLGDSRDARLDNVSERAVVDPAAELAALVARWPAARAIVGGALAARLGPALLAHPRVLVSSADFLCTSAWITLAEHWPVPGPVLVADYDPYARRLFSCGLSPAGAP
jgi:hypothetical protein